MAAAAWLWQWPPPAVQTPLLPCFRPPLNKNQGTHSLTISTTRSMFQSVSSSPYSIHCGQRECNWCAGCAGAPHSIHLHCLQTCLCLAHLAHLAHRPELPAPVPRHSPCSHPHRRVRAPWRAPSPPAEGGQRDEAAWARIMPSIFHDWSRCPALLRSAQIDYLYPRHMLHQLAFP